MASNADLCPRCGQAFHCGAHDAAPCACAGLRLEAALLSALRARYETCLCLACLAELQKDAADGAEPAWLRPVEGARGR